MQSGLQFDFVADFLYILNDLPLYNGIYPYDLMRIIHTRKESRIAHSVCRGFATPLKTYLPFSME